MKNTIELASNATTIATVDVDNAIRNNNGVTMNDQWFEVRRYAAPSYDAYQNAEYNNIALLTETGSVYMFLKEVEPIVVEIISTTEKNVKSNTPNGVITKLSDDRYLWVAMMSTSNGKSLCNPLGMTHMEIFDGRDCCFMDDTEYQCDQAIDQTNDINRPLNIIDIDQLLARGKDMLETDNVDVMYMESKDKFTVTVESAFLMPTGDGGTYWEREIDSFESYTPRGFGIHLDKMEDEAESEPVTQIQTLEEIYYEDEEDSDPMDY